LSVVIFEGEYLEDFVDGMLREETAMILFAQWAFICHT